eukprot:jgi/Ulvmu1/9105/UM005_0200.1
MLVERLFVVFAAVLLLTGCYVHAQNGCTLSLEIDPTQSTWEVSAFVNNATGGRVDSDVRTERLGAQGRMFLFTTGACPRSVATALDVLQGAKFGAYFPVDNVHARMWPPTIQTNTPNIGRLDVQSLEWHFTSQIFNALTLEDAAVGETMLQRQLAGFTTTVTGGLVWTKSAQSSVIKYRQLPTLPSSTGANVTVIRQDESVLRFKFQNIQLPLILDAEFGNITRPAQLTFRGDVVADMVVGCPLFCGPKGTCKLKNGEPKCVCDCGWTGFGCGLAEGFCPLPMSYLLPGNTSNVPAADISEISDRAPLQTCARQDPENGTCLECLNGYDGYSCNLCETDAACSVLRPDLPNPTCDRSFEYSRTTITKQYSCDLRRVTGLADLLLPEFRFQCNTTSIRNRAPISLNPDGTGPFVNVSQLAEEQPNSPEAFGGTCELSFTTKNAWGQPIMCLAWGCVFAEGFSQVQCARVKCDCPNPLGCPEPLDTIVPNLNEDTTVICGNITRGGNEPYCRIEIKNLPFLLEAPCIAAECVGNETTNATTVALENIFDSKATTNWNVILSGIPIFFAAGLAFLILLVTIPRMLGVSRAVRHVRRQDTVAVAGKGWVGLTGAAPVAFTFSDIYLDAPPPRGGLLQRAGGDGEAKAEGGPVGEGTEHVGAAGGSGVASPNGIGEAVRSTDASVRLQVSSDHNGSQEPGSPLMLGAGNTVAYQLPGRELSQSSGSTSNVIRAGKPIPMASPPSKGKAKAHILQDVSGAVQAGEILAIMGPSGAGKSSLLAILSQQPQLLPKKAAPRGRVGVTWADDIVQTQAVTPEASKDSLPGAQPTPMTGFDIMQLAPAASHNGKQRKATLGFVQQHDCLMPTLTVTETVLLGMMFREYVKGKDIEDAGTFVYALLKDLGLLGCAHRMVGGSSGIVGVSGGERRRVSIALELCARPDMLMMDEVTSGLDSYTAHRLTSMLKTIAVDHSRIMIASIHQPSQAIFAQMDRLLLLHLGRAVFSGPAAELEGVLGRAGVTREPEVPMADFLLQLVNEPAQLRAVSEYSAATPYGRGIAGGQPATAWIKARVRSRSVPILYRMGILVWRALLDVWRNWSMLIMTAVVATLFGVFVGLVFWKLEDGISGVQNRAGAIFFTLVFLDLLAVTSIDSLLNERAVIRKEVRLGYYPAFIYMVAKTLVDALLLRALPAVLFGLPVYYMAELREEDSRIFMFMFVLVAFAIATQLQAMVIVEWSKRAGTATVVFVLVLVVSMLFGGFLVNSDTMHPAIAWVQYLSLVYYAFEAMAVNEFKGSRFNFSVESLGSLDNVDGEVIAETLGINMGNLRRDIVLIVSWAAGLFLILLLSPYVRRMLGMR